MWNVVQSLTSVIFHSIKQVGFGVAHKIIIEMSIQVYEYQTFSNYIHI